MSKTSLLNIGYGNFVVSSRIICIVNPTSSPMRRLREEAKTDKRLIDATQGRKTRSIVITDSNHVVLSAIQAETIGQRFSVRDDGADDEK
jgi:extracellular matrix regulatory protein A